MDRKVIVITLLVAVAILFAATIDETTTVFPPRNYSTLHVSLGEEFVLHKNQTAIIDSDGFQVKVTGFIYSPCPPGAQCFWSGLGVNFEYFFQGNTTTGMNMAQAFGHQISTIDSDYKTFAKLKVEKLD